MAKSGTKFVVNSVTIKISDNVLLSVKESIIAYIELASSAVLNIGKLF